MNVARGVMAAGLLLAAGCRMTTEVGQSVSDVVRAHPGQRIEYFDKDGKAVPELPRGQAGSISIYTEGQDNYAFDEHGRVLKHQRSHGADYSEGVWRDAE